MNRLAMSASRPLVAVVDAIVALVAVVVLAVTWTTDATAATVQYTSSFGFTHTGTVSSGLVSVGATFNNSVVTNPTAMTLARFDPSLGRLTGVDVTVATSTASFAVSPSGLLSLVSYAAATRTLGYTITAGTTTATGSNAVANSGPSLVTLLGLGVAEIGGAPLAATKSFSAAADLAQFTGTGTMSVALSATDALTVTTLVSAVNGAGLNGSGNYAGTATVTYTYVPTQTVSGYVYADANRSGTRDAGENGIGSGLYVKLATYSGGACQAPALQAAAVDATTGAYTMTADQGSTYCLIVDNNATLSDVVPTLPAGYAASETPTGIRTVALATAAATAQNFGVFTGSSLAGRVFTDNGAGGGTANDGLPNGTEAGVAGVTVTVKSGATAVASATTDATGAYIVLIPSSATGTLTVVGAVPSGTLAVGGSPGTTAGSYARATNTTTFTVAAGNAYTGVHFGTAPVNVLSTTGAQTAGPGATVPYAHTFTAGSAGSVVFSTAATSTPSAAWLQSIVVDTNCNGVVDGGEAVVGGAVAMTAGQTICLIVRDAMPAGVANGAQDVVTLTATMTYANATPSLAQAVARTDTTTVSTATLLQLAKQVRNLTQGGAFATANGAAPNDLLEYQVTVTNPAGSAVSVLVVNDTTPTYTAFDSAACPGTLPTGVTACTVTTQPASGGQGAVQWTFSGTLAASGTLGMTYRVRVSQ